MKYAVIFKAQINILDEKYSAMVQQLRELAFNEYHCQDFVAYTEGDKEVAISYWQSLDDIKNWQANTLHLTAQKFGQQKWYKSYQVQVVEILREYSLL